MFSVQDDSTSVNTYVLCLNLYSFKFKQMHRLTNQVFNLVIKSRIQTFDGYIFLSNVCVLD